MPVNLKKIAKDIFHDDQDVQLLALTTVVQLSPQSILEPNDLGTLIKSLEQAVDQGTGDVLFLARKGLNHLRSLEGHCQPEASDTTPRAQVRQSRERLLKTIEHHDTDMQLATAVSELIREGTGEDVEKLLPLLEHRDPRVRSNVIEFLERHATEQTILDHCVPLLRDENNRVIGTAATALGRVGHPLVADHLRKLMADHRISVRESAVYALSNVKGPAVVDLLIEALRDPYEGIRLRAVSGLGRHKDPRALPHLKQLLNDVDPAICEEAERAIAFISMEEATGFREGRMDLDERVSPDQVPPATAGREEGAPSPAAQDELRQLGQQIFTHQQAGTFTNEAIDKLCYAIVKVTSFLGQHHRRATEKATEGNEGLLAAVRADLGDPQQAEEKAIEELEERLTGYYVELGKIAIEQCEANTLDLTGDDALSRRVETLKEKLGR